jgi:hypothetical protein
VISGISRRYLEQRQAEANSLESRGRAENYFIASDGEHRYLISARKAVGYGESIYEDQFR